MWSFAFVCLSLCLYRTGALKPYLELLGVNSEWKNLKFIV